VSWSPSRGTRHPHRGSTHRSPFHGQGESDRDGAGTQLPAGRANVLRSPGSSSGLAPPRTDGQTLHEPPMPSGERTRGEPLEHDRQQDRPGDRGGIRPRVDASGDKPVDADGQEHIVSFPWSLPEGSDGAIGAAPPSRALTHSGGCSGEGNDRQLRPGSRIPLGPKWRSRGRHRSAVMRHRWATGRRGRQRHGGRQRAGSRRALVHAMLPSAADHPCTLASGCALASMWSPPRSRRSPRLAAGRAARARQKGVGMCFSGRSGST